MSRKPEQIESHVGWSRWGNHLRFPPNDHALDCNAQHVSFCAPRTRRKCVQLKECQLPLIMNPSARTEFLKKYGVKSRGRSFLAGTDPEDRKNVAWDWDQVERLRKQLFKVCRPIRVVMTERKDTE